MKRIITAGFFVYCTLFFQYSASADRHARADDINGQGADVYVDDSAPSGGDGHSFAEAYKDLQAALNVATDQDGDGDIEVWIAQGTYTPDAYNREVSFDLKDNMHLLGGYRGAYGIDSNDGLKRDPSVYETRLSGEIGSVGTSDNSRHVITVRDKTNVVLYGLTIAGGNDDAPVASVGDGLSPPFIAQGYGRGGGLLASGTEAARAGVTIVDCIFTGNGSVVGGAIYGDRVSLNVAGSAFDQNGEGAVFGGAIYLDGFSDLEVTESVFTGNIATVGDEPSGGAIFVGPVWLSFLDGRLDYANAPNDPGSAATTTIVVVSGSTFTGNLSDFGGAVEIDGGFLNGSGLPAGDDYGRTSATIVGTRFESNGTSETGSAAFFRHGAQVEIKKSMFTKNVGYRAINTVERAGLNVSDSDFIENDGGALRFQSASITGQPNTIVGSTFAGNHIEGPTAIGGAIESTSPDTRVIKSTFTDNYAANGGAIAGGFFGGISIEGSTFNGNRAVNGGAIFNFLLGTMMLDNNRFTHNVAASVGGAVFHQDGAMLIGDSHFESNASSNVGGAVFAQTTLGVPFNMTITDSHFHHNSTTAEVGGGIFAQNINLEVGNNVFVGNTDNPANELGDALFWWDTTGGDFADFTDLGKNKYAGDNTPWVLFD